MLIKREGLACSLIIFLVFLSSSGRAAEEVQIFNLSSLPSSWSKAQQPTITWEVRGEAVDYEYIVDKILDGVPTGDWQSTNSMLQSFVITHPLPTGEYEFWLRAKDKEGVFSPAQMVLVYVDVTKPSRPEDLKVEKIDERYVVFFSYSLDIGSGLDHYEGRVGEGEVEVVTSGSWFLTLAPGTYNIKVWAVDKAGNKSLPAGISYTTSGELPPKKAKPPSRLTHSGRWGYLYRNVSATKGKAVEGFYSGYTVEQSLWVKLGGTIGDLIEVEGTIEQMPAQDQKVLIELKKKDTAGIKYGNFETSFGGGEFTGLMSKSIEGVEGWAKLGRFNLKVLIPSQSKSMPKTETRQGGNIKGPYQFSSWIVEGSEQIRITDPTHTWYDLTTGGSKVMDNLILERSKDYVINYITGEVTFINVVFSTATITASYEYALPFAIRSGDLFGCQGIINLSKKANLGITYLGGKANRLSALTTSFIKNSRLDAYTDPEDRARGREYPLDNWPIVKGTVTVEVNGEVKENEEYNIGKGDYQIDYGRGTLSFLHVPPERIPPGAGDIIDADYNYQVAFSYKTDSFQGADSWIYSLTFEGFSGAVNEKNVRVWITKNNEERFLLEKSRYSIDENNKITFSDNDNDDDNGAFPPDSGDTIEVEYREVPSVSEAASVKRGVLGLNANFNLGEKITVESEFALSNSDRGTLGTSQTDTFIVVGDESIDLKGPYQLTKGPVIPESETVKINNVPKSRRQDYYIDNNAGEITFLGNAIPRANDKIEVTYKYLSPTETLGEAEMIKGEAFKVRLRAKSAKLNLETYYRYVEPKFIPVGVIRPVPENQGLGARLAYQFSKRFSLNSVFSRSKKPTEVLIGEVSGIVTTTTTYQQGLNLNLPKFPQITLNYQENKQENNEEIPLRTYNKTSSAGLQYSKKKIKTSFNFNQTKSSSLSQESTTTGNRFNLNLTPSKRLSISTDLSQNVMMETFTATTSTRSSTGASSFDLRLRPTEVVNISSKYDLQRVKSASTNPYTLTTVETGLSCSPFKVQGVILRKSPLPVSSLTLNYHYNKNPSSAPGGIITKRSSLYAGIKPLPILSLTTSLNYSSSRQENGTGSSSQGATLGANLAPERGRKWSLNLNQSFQKSKSFTLSGSPTITNTENTTLRSSITISPFTVKGVVFRKTPLKIKPIKVNAGYGLSKQKSPASPDSHSTTTTTSLDYKLSQKMSLTTGYSQQSYSGTSNTRQGTTSLSLNYNLPEKTTLSLEGRLTNFVNKKDSKQNYNGSIMTVRLTANF